MSTPNKLRSRCLIHIVVQEQNGVHNLKTQQARMKKIVRRLSPALVLSLISAGFTSAGVVDLVSGKPDVTDADLRLWLDAGDASTLFQDVDGNTPAADGLPVSRWEDKSLSGIAVVQSTAGNAPTFSSSVGSLNNQPAVRFRGGSGGDALTSTSGNSTGLSGAASLTVVTVWKTSGFTSQNFQHTFHMGNAACNQAYGHSVSRGGNAGEVGNHYWCPGFDSSARSQLLSSSVAVSSYDGTVDRWYVNGTFAGETTIAVNLGTDQLQIGSRLSPFTEGFTGDLAEVIVFGVVLTEEERTALTDHLIAKYEIDGEVEPPVLPPDPLPSGGVNLATGEPQADHPNLAVWFDASDPATLWQDVDGTIPAADGLPVVRWDDKGSLGVVTLQGNAANAPSFTAATDNLAGRPSVSFVGGGGGDALTSITGNSTGISGADNLTMVTVWETTGTTGQNYQHTVQIGNASCNQAYGHSVSRTGNVGELSNHYWCAGHNAFNSTSLNTGYFALSTYDGTTDQFYLDGVPGAPHEVTLNIGAGQLQLGSRLDPFTEGFTGNLAEVIIFRQVLNESERNALGYYIQNKYGMTVEGAAGQKLFNLTEVRSTNTTVELAWEDFGPGAVYTVESSNDGEQFEVVAGFDAVGSTSVSVPRPTDRRVLYRVRAEIVPRELVNEDFETGAAGWTTGSDSVAGATTVWELGTPVDPNGPAGAHGGSSCFGTDLGANYVAGADIWLRSPEIDLTAGSPSTLSFWHYHDTESGVDSCTVRVIDAATGNEIAVLATYDNFITNWENQLFAVPVEALGNTIKIEFRFVSDPGGSSFWPGWFVDDVLVTSP